MKRVAILTTIVAVVVGAFVAATLPPRHLMLSTFDDGTIAGSMHIHTSRSDGRDTPDKIAAVAARVGLKFIVFTDHGDATRTPDRPAYRSGVLCLDGVEVSTAGGHYVALDMPAAPYPLAGEPRDVVDDVRRLGGFGIAAHPDSPKPALRWRDWTAPFDGVEWINPDTSWRVHAAGAWRSRLQLAEALLHYPIRSGETLANLLTGVEQTMSRWNELAEHRRVVGLAGVDAHAKLDLRNADSGDNRYSLPLPSYDASFRTLSVHISPDRPLSGDAAADAALLMRAIRAGHLYAAIDGLAGPASFEFTATNARGTAHEGDELGVGGHVSLHIRSNAPPGFTTIVWRGTEMVATEAGRDLTINAGDQPAVYRAEIRNSDPAHPLTWLLSNPIYVRAPDVRTLPQRAQATMSMPMFDGRTMAGWHVETDATSLAAVELTGTTSDSELRLRYGLADGTAGDQRATLVWGPPIGSRPGTMAPYDRLTFTARAERPMRISVQLRTPDVGRTLRRWQRSVYLDTFAQQHTVYFDDLRPSADADTWKPPLDQVNAVLFVVDTTNTKPGASGRVWIKNPSLQK